MIQSLQNLSLERGYYIWIHLDKHCSWELNYNTVLAFYYFYLKKYVGKGISKRSAGIQIRGIWGTFQAAISLKACILIPSLEWLMTHVLKVLLKKNNVFCFFWSFLSTFGIFNWWVLIWPRSSRLLFQHLNLGIPSGDKNLLEFCKFAQSLLERCFSRADNCLPSC